MPNKGSDVVFRHRTGDPRKVWKHFAKATDATIEAVVLRVDGFFCDSGQVFKLSEVEVRACTCYLGAQ